MIYEFWLNIIKREVKKKIQLNTIPTFDLLNLKSKINLTFV